MKEIKRYTYTIKIHPADADETGFWVEVPALPGCFTQGETYEEAVMMAQDAIRGYIQMLAELGEPIPEEPAPKLKKTFNALVQVPVSLLA